MKESELPQEKGALRDLTELCYVTDDEGNYTTRLSSGWEVKNVALEASLGRLQEQIDEAKEDVLEGRKSPIVYYMLLNRIIHYRASVLYASQPYGLGCPRRCYAPLAMGYQASRQTFSIQKTIF